MKYEMKSLFAVICAAAALTGCATVESTATAAAAAVEAPAPYAKPGFYASQDKDGRLWVFPEGHADLLAYQTEGKPARQVRRIGAGPQGQTLISTEMEHITAYIIAKPGYYASIDKDGRLWVFPEGHADHVAYLAEGKPARQVRRIGAGPGGQTIISTEMEHIDGYLAK